MKVTVPMPLPNKANTYEVKFNPTFWRAIYQIASGMKAYMRGPLYWIGPSKAVKEAELAIAYIAKLSIADDTAGPVQLDIWISNRLDADCVKAVLDGIQKSGRIVNDRQIVELLVHKVEMKNESFSFDITPL
jgi:hypothetical protein